MNSLHNSNAWVVRRRSSTITTLKLIEDEIKQLPKQKEGIVHLLAVLLENLCKLMGLQSGKPTTLYLSK